jgi:hypothetical protein
LLDFDEACQFLKVKASWLYDHTSRSLRIVPHHKIGGLIRFWLSDLIDFVQNHRRGSVPKPLQN